MSETWHLLSTEQAAKQLGVSVDAVRRYHHAGVLAGRKHGRSLLIEQRAVLSLQKIMHQAATGKRPEPPQRRMVIDTGNADCMDADHTDNGVNCNTVLRYSDSEDLTV